MTYRRMVILLLNACFVACPDAKSAATLVGYALARRHAQRAIQPEGRAVDVPVADQKEDNVRIFFRAPETLWKRDSGRQRVLHVLWQAGEHGCTQDARQDRIHPDALAHEIARDRQGHTL